MISRISHNLSLKIKHHHRDQVRPAETEAPLLVKELFVDTVNRLGIAPFREAVYG